jgi:hydrogenase maturation factor
LGIEGTAILSVDRQVQLTEKIDDSTLKRGAAFFDQISVVKEALLAFETGCVTAMHDPTEGGVAGGIHELADASKLGVKVIEEEIVVADETLKICEFFGIDPMQLIASGSLLIVVEKDGADRVVKLLKRNGVVASVIGEFLPSPKKRLIIRRDNSINELVRPVSDHLWLALKNRQFSKKK